AAAVEHLSELALDARPRAVSRALERGPVARDRLRVRAVERVQVPHGLVDVADRRWRRGRDPLLDGRLALADRVVEGDGLIERRDPELRVKQVRALVELPDRGRAVARE